MTALFAPIDRSGRVNRRLSPWSRFSPFSCSFRLAHKWRRYSDCMKRAIFLAFASIGFAQTQPDAMALLRGVASLAQSNNRWLIEGVTAASGQPEKATFSLRRESAKEVRFESHGGADPAEIVCDGTNKWIYSIPLHRYSRTPLTDSSVCVPVLDEWANLPERLGSPVAAGTSNYSAGEIGRAHV